MPGGETSPFEQAGVDPQVGYGPAGARPPAWRYAVIYLGLATAVESGIASQTPAAGARRPVPSDRLRTQEPPEVRHGERDQPPLRAVDQALLDQPVPGRRHAGRLAAQLVGDLGGRHR